MPGLFTNYLTYPYRFAEYFRPFETQIDFNKRRALTLDGGDNDRITLTTVQDFANVVSRAVEYEGEWPVVGGIRGSELSIGDVLVLGRKIRGMFPIPFILFYSHCPVLISNDPGEPFHVEKLKAEDLKVGMVKCSWLPSVDHSGIPRAQAEALAPMLVAGMLLAISAGALKVTDEWNRLLPDYQFAQAGEFLAKAWRDKL